MQRPFTPWRWHHHFPKMCEAYGTINRDLGIVLSAVLGGNERSRNIRFHDWSLHMQAFLPSL